MRAGNIYGGSRRQHDSEPFIVYEKEGVILPDRTSNRRSPLIYVVERTWGVAPDIEIVVGVQRGTIPVIDRVAVVFVSARLTHKVDIGADQTAVVARITVVHYGYALHLVRA